MIYPQKTLINFNEYHTPSDYSIRNTMARSMKLFFGAFFGDYLVTMLYFWVFYTKFFLLLGAVIFAIQSGLIRSKMNYDKPDDYEEDHELYGDEKIEN